MSRTIDELLRLARTADPTTRIQTWRNAIAEHGTAGIDAISGWLEDAKDGPFAVSVIAWMGEHGHRAAAVKALRNGRATARSGQVRRHIDGALLRLGATVPSGDGPRNSTFVLPRGVRLAPPYKDAHHIVLDHLVDSGTRWGAIYLFECGRWFSEGWVRQHGGLVDPTGQAICDQCSRAMGRGR